MKTQALLFQICLSILLLDKPLTSQNFCDFDGDGYSDLAIGVPGESVNGVEAAGAVQILYGSANGITAIGDQLWHRDSPGIQGFPNANDRFGRSLACGDFDDDGYTDLAIGVPYQDVLGLVDSGSIHVLYGSPSGLTSIGDQIWHQGTPGILGALETEDYFGLSLTSGDFDGDGCADLAVGAPLDSVNGQAQAGAVNVLYGSPIFGLTTAGDQIWHQDSSGVIGVTGLDDFFGTSLAAGDFDNDGRCDLAIAVPRDDVGGILQAGAVNVLYGSANGLTSIGDQLWNQNSPGVVGVAEASDNFGGNWGFGSHPLGSLTAADFNNDGCADLAVGVPGERLEALGIDAGAVNVLYGSLGAGLTATGDQIWHQETPGIEGVAEDFDHFGGTLAAGDFDGNGGADLVVGVNFESVGSQDLAGAVNIIYSGFNSALTASGDDIWHQNVSGVKGVAEFFDFFSWSVATGDFNGDGFADLAVGAPDETVSGGVRAGMIHVFYGSLFAGITATGDQIWHQDSASVIGLAEDGDDFGFSLASGGP